MIDGTAASLAYGLGLSLGMLLLEERSFGHYRARPTFSLRPGRLRLRGGDLLSEVQGAILAQLRSPAQHTGSHAHWSQGGALLEAGRDLLDRLPEHRVVLRSGDGLFQRLGGLGGLPEQATVQVRDHLGGRCDPAQRVGVEG